MQAEPEQQWQDSLAAKKIASYDQQMKGSQIPEPAPGRVVLARRPWEARSGLPVAGASEDQTPPVRREPEPAPGQVVLAGSFTRPVPARPGDTFHVDYGPLGAIACRFV